MSRYLVSGLLAEGPEDELFLRRLVVRQLTALSTSAAQSFDVQPEMLPYGGSRCSTARTAHKDLCEAVQELARDCDLVMVHNDHRERGKIEKIRQEVRLPDHCRLVGIVPVRETEAWILADSRLLRSLPGADVLPFPQRAAAVEKIDDPKSQLERVLPGQRLKEVAQDLGDRVDLARLTTIPAYRAWLDELTRALKELHFL